MENITIENEMDRVASIKNSENREYSQRKNDAPCAVCGNKKFVQKFRNVVGEISGSMCGYFSLFGGSISGSIDGYTKTLPVLSCRKCENEREILTWNYISGKEEFWNFMYEFYFQIDSDYSHNYKVDPFFLERPVETREYMKKNYNWEYDFYNKIPNWSPEVWAKVGFKIPKIKKRHFLFWEKEVFPSWEELTEIKSK